MSGVVLGSNSSAGDWKRMLGGMVIVFATSGKLGGSVQFCVTEQLPWVPTCVRLQVCSSVGVALFFMWVRKQRRPGGRVGGWSSCARVCWVRGARVQA